MIKTSSVLSVSLAMLLMMHPVGAAEAARCAQIADPQSRLLCYDAVYPPVRSMPAAPAVAAVAPAPAPAPAAAPAPAPVPPPASKPDASSKLFGLLPSRSKPKPDMASLHAMVAQVQMNPSGQVITLNNGQVWQLTEYQRDPFVKAGEGVVIDPASLGSFLMAAERGGLSVRVKRLR